MKKLLLGLGAIAAVATPVVAVVSCGNQTVGYTIDLSSLPTDKTERELNIEQQLGKLRSWSAFHSTDKIIIRVKIDENTIMESTLQMGRDQLTWDWRDFKTYILTFVPASYL